MTKSTNAEHSSTLAAIDATTANRNAVSREITWHCDYTLTCHNR